MRKTRATMLIGVVVFACAKPNAGPAALAEADMAAIRTAAVGFQQAVRDTAWDSWATTYYTSDAWLLPPNGPAISGHAGIVNLVRGFPPNENFTLNQVKVDGLGDLAYVYGRYSWTIKIPGMPAMPDSGKYIEIWRKQADGGWKITHDIFNSDVPLPAPAPAAKK